MPPLRSTLQQVIGLMPQGTPPEETGKAIRDALLAFATCQAYSELHGVFQPEQFLRLDALFRQHGKTTPLADMVRALGELSFADILPSPVRPTPTYPNRPWK